MCENCRAAVTMDNPDRLLTPAEFQRWARISRTQWFRLCEAGKAPRRFKEGRIVRIKVRDALNWADARSV